MSDLALDTSVAVPFLMESHSSHRQLRRRLAGRSLVLTAHSLAETYSVITRLPGDARLSPSDAADIIEGAFGPPALLDPASVASLPALLAPLGIAGGAVYDALVGLAATRNGLPLATRDARAAPTYAALGVEVEVTG